MMGRLASEADRRLDVIRTSLRFFGPARVQDTAAHLDAPLRDVKAHWPQDVVEVSVVDGAGPAGRARFVLAGDAETLASPPEHREPEVRLLGPYDPYLQLRDRELLVPDGARRKELWPALGRPGAITDGGELLGTWRPRLSGGRLTVRIQPWRPLSRPVRTRVEEQAERLSAHRHVTLAGVVEQ